MGEIFVWLAASAGLYWFLSMFHALHQIALHINAISFDVSWFQLAFIAGSALIAFLVFR